MLEKIKTYLNIEDEEQDFLLETLIENAEAFFEDYTLRASADYQTVIFKMVIEDYNRYGSEGIASLNFGAGSENVLTDYSDGLRAQIRKLKKVKIV